MIPSCTHRVKVRTYDASPFGGATLISSLQQDLFADAPKLKAENHAH